MAVFGVFFAETLEVAVFFKVAFFVVDFVLGDFVAFSVPSASFSSAFLVCLAGSVTTLAFSVVLFCVADCSAVGFIVCGVTFTCSLVAFSLCGTGSVVMFCFTFCGTYWSAFALSMAFLRLAFSFARRSCFSSAVSFSFFAGIFSTTAPLFFLSIRRSLG